MAGALIETHFHKGEVVIHEGDIGDAFFILSKGEIAFKKRNAEGAEEEVALMDAAKPSGSG